MFIFILGIFCLVRFWKEGYCVNGEEVVGLVFVGRVNLSFGLIWRVVGV